MSMTSMFHRLRLYSLHTIIVAGTLLPTAFAQNEENTQDSSSTSQTPIVSEASESPSGGKLVNAIDVRDYGAVSSAEGDQTVAFQAALDAAKDSDTQTVFVPRGNYRFDGSLTMPVGVTLVGVSESVPAHNGIRDRGMPRPTETGTTFLVCGGANTVDAEGEPLEGESGTPFITLNTNSTVKGICFYYPDQDPAAEPMTYPWCVAMRGKNPAILDCELLNPYLGIDASQNERHLIRNISGQPLKLGVWVDAIYDIGRIENVHFNPWWSMQPKLFAWQMANGVAFRFARTDWQYVINTFCFGYKIGYHFAESKSGGCNGNFLGIGADDCQTSLVVDQCAPMGLLITNGEFVSFHGPNPTMVRVAASNRGSVRFVNCAFWGPCRQIAEIDGTTDGTVGFGDCTFVQWGFATADQPDLPACAAINAQGGTLLVRGCEFRQNRPQFELGEKLRKVVITDNIFNGKTQITQAATLGEPRVVIHNNASDE